MSLSKPLLTILAVTLSVACAPPETTEANVETVTITEQVDELEIEQGSWAPITVTATDRTDVAVTATVVGVAALHDERSGGRLSLSHTCEYPEEDVRHESPCYVRFEAEVPRTLRGLFLTASTSTIDVDVDDVASLFVSSGNSSVSVDAGTVSELAVVLNGPGDLSVDVQRANTASVFASNAQMDVAIADCPIVRLERGAGDGRATLGTAPESLVLDAGGASGSFEIELPRGAYEIQAHPDALLRLEGITNQSGAGRAISLLSGGSVTLTGR